MTLPHVSLIICTRNRAESLAKTLEALRHQALPDGLEWELLVVDNGSTDDTASVLHAATQTNCRLRVHLVPTRGKSIACNHAIRIARGCVLAWTDDDVVPSGQWLARLVKPIVEDHADAVQGAVIIPNALAAMMQGTLLATRHAWVGSTHTVDFSQPDRLIGANMAFHRRLLDRVGGFDEHLGPGKLGFGEDTLLAYHCLQHGYRLRGVLDAAVYHYFDTSRITNDAAVQIGGRMAASEAYLDWHFRGVIRTPPSWPLFKARGKRRLRELLGQHRFPTDLEAWERELGYQYWQSYWREYGRQCRQPRRYCPEGVGGTNSAC